MNLQAKNIDKAKEAARRLVKAFEILACLDVSDERYRAYLTEAQNAKHELDVASEHFITYKP